MNSKSLLENRLAIVFKYMIIVFMILMVVLFKIQIIDHGKLRTKADRQNSIKLSREPIRGDILDRNGIPFTSVRERLCIKVFPRLIDGREDALKLVGLLTGQDTKKLQKLIEQSEQQIEMAISNMDHVLIGDIMRGLYPGIYIYAENIRYSEDSIARHIIGYIRKDGKAMMGIEKEFDAFLDSNGSSIIYTFKDVNNNPIVGTGYRYEQIDSQYYDVQLTLDHHIQNSLEQILDNARCRGGAVVVEIDTGDILAAASRPNYMQYDIEGSTEPDCLWAVPFRAFPPGSVFKTVVAAAALEQGRYLGDDIFYCDGGIYIDSVFYSCNGDRGGLGRLTLREAFARSCNDTFISIAQELGGSTIIELAREFGFDRKLDIGFANDKGELPDRDVYAGAGMGNLALGQGDVMVTPLQVADMMVSIANGGVRKPLRLVRQLISSSGESISWQGTDNEYRVLKEETAKELSRWLVQAAKNGTGRRAYGEEFGGCGGKTGTPEITNDIHADHYGWFAGFFPAYNPRYAITILSREDGVGGITAAPLFKEIAKAIWEYESNIKYIE